MNIIESEFNNLLSNLSKKGIDISNITLQNIVDNFEDSLSKDYKKKHGIVYTPKWVADGMAELSLERWLNSQLGYNHLNVTQRDQFIQIKNKLDNIKICDPCVGSGVYIFSIIKELTKIYRIISKNLDTEYKELDTLLNIIKNNIYAMDIDSSAVEISIFRLWVFLSNYGYDKGLEEFKSNIYVGESVWHSFEGLNIEYDRELTDVNPDIRNIFIDDWILAYDKYIHIKDEENRDKYKAKADVINLAIKISSTITGQEIPYKYDWKMAKNKGKDKLFNWYLEFNEVFNNKNIKDNGFDIIIGNPPYVRNIDTELFSYNVEKPSDLYIEFLNLLKTKVKENGLLCMITPNGWFSSAGAINYRSYIINHIDTIIDFNALMLFDNAYVPTAISLAIKGNKEDYINYSNIGHIVVDNKIGEFKEYYTKRQLKISKNTLLNTSNRKWIFGEPQLYNILKHIMSYRTLDDVYEAEIFRGEIIEEVNRKKLENTDSILDESKRYIIKGEDALKFGTLTKSSLVTDIDSIKNSADKYENCIVIPEITHYTRACRIKNIIPLDSLIVIKPKTELECNYLLAILNSEIYDIIYNILYCTNYMISFGNVRFPRKSKALGLVPVPEINSMVALDKLIKDTNNLEHLTQIQHSELNIIIQSLYGLTDEDMEVLRRYNI